MLFLSLDIGTTCSKAQVFDERGNILFYRSRECPLMEIDGEKYADIAEIKNAVFSLIREAAETGGISSVAISSFGEAFVLLDKKDKLLTYPMLYTDPRGADEAREAEKLLGGDAVFARTGTVPNAMYSLYKYLWLCRHKKEAAQKADKLLLIGDYFGYLLSGKRVIDYGLAARTGAFDVYEKQFSDEILSVFGVDKGLFSEPRPAGWIVGNVLQDVAEALGLDDSCRLVLGSHDQICATLGAGVTKAGESADGMGTVECITAVFDQAQTNASFGNMGYCVVPYIDGLYCTYILNYTSNAIVNWFRRDILHGYDGGFENQFDYLESSESPTDILCLPYFAGAATPYSDENAKGAFLNLTVDSKASDLYRAILEGTSFEMRLNLETVNVYGISVDRITATGGGANSALWLQIKSDVLGIPVKTLRSSEGGLCGCAMLQAVALGVCKTYEEAKAAFVRYRGEWTPSLETAGAYEEKYRKYKKLYRILKEIN